MTRTITTAAERDALPTGSVVYSLHEGQREEPIYVRQEDGWYCGWGWEGASEPSLPARVLCDPSAPAAQPAPEASREDVAFEIATHFDTDGPLDLATRLRARFVITERGDR